MYHLQFTVAINGSCVGNVSSLYSTGFYEAAKADVAAFLGMNVGDILDKKKQPLPCQNVTSLKPVSHTWPNQFASKPVDN